MKRLHSLDGRQPTQEQYLPDACNWKYGEPLGADQFAVVVGKHEAKCNRRGRQAELKLEALKKAEAAGSSIDRAAQATKANWHLSKYSAL